MKSKNSCNNCGGEMILIKIIEIDNCVVNAYCDNCGVLYPTDEVFSYELAEAQTMTKTNDNQTKQKPSERIEEIFNELMINERDDSRVNLVWILAITKYLDEQAELGRDIE